MAEDVGVVCLSVDRAAGYDEMKEAAVTAARPPGTGAVFSLDRRADDSAEAAGLRACPDVGDLIDALVSLMRPTPLAPQVRDGSRAAFLLGAVW